MRVFDLFLRSFLLFSFLFLSFDAALYAQEVNPEEERFVLSLEDVLRRARAQSPAAKRAETRRENNFWNYRLFRSNYNPQLRLGGTVPAFSQAFSNVVQPDGSILFREVRQNLADLEIGMEQEIAATGGRISVNSSTSRFDNFLAPEGFPQTQWQGVPVNVRLNQPIFAFNPLKWDKMIEPLRYEAANKSFVEEMEEINFIVTSIYFDFLVAQANVEIASLNLLNTQDIYKIEQRRYEMGATYEDKLLQIELQVLQAKQDLAQAQLDLDRSSLSLKAFVGLNERSQLILLTPTEIPEAQIDFSKALDLAFQNRADAVNFDIQNLEAEAAVARARGERFALNLNASYGLNNAALQWTDIYTNPNTQTLVNMSFFIPVLDWGRNKARMGQARANRELVQYTVEQDIINFEQEIFTKVRNFSMLKERLEITELADKVAEKRYNLALRRYQESSLSLTDLTIAQQEKDQNRRAYITALKAYWEAYYELRRLTLYDFANDQLLYNPELENAL